MMHDISALELVDGTGDGIVHLVCTCGGLDKKVDIKYADSIQSRHLLVNEIWPFEARHMPSEWPHNTPEDDELSKRQKGES